MALSVDRLSLIHSRGALLFLEEKMIRFEMSVCAILVIKVVERKSSNLKADDSQCMSKQLLFILQFVLKSIGEQWRQF